MTTKDTLTWEQLSSEQQAAFKAIRDLPYTFLTGSAGVGKSTVIRYAVENIPGLEPTGSTGVAALAISGKTLHSWSAIGLGKQPAEILYAQIKFSKNICQRLQNSKHVLIDEVSMVDAETLDKIDYILQKIRNSNLPFGGIHVTLCGDALQLPVVAKEKGFFFDSEFYKEAKFKVLVLTEPFRQRNSNFVEILGKIRLGIVDDSVLKFIEKAKANKKPETGIQPVVLHCMNKDVDFENKQNYDKIDKEENTYYAIDVGEKSDINNLDRHCPARKELKLKISAQVMLLANIDTEGGFVNGSVGIIDGFTEDKKPIVLFTGGRRKIIERHRWEIKEIDLASKTRPIKYKIFASRSQIPLRHAWSTTVHKSQGSTLDIAIIDLSEAFEYGQAYVALSRVKDEEGLFLRACNPLIKAHPRCLEFYGYDENGIKKSA